MPGEDHCLGVVQQSCRDPGGVGTDEAQQSLGPCARSLDRPLPEDREQQSSVGPRGVESPQQEEERLGLLLQAPEEGTHGPLRTAFPAQHPLQVQEEFRRRLSHQGSDE